ncbi:hypothetical protein SMF913_25578 [Streptomyces malaysiensis]|uniref:Uncharacterized protein n=1 Tax=Streptomyces malaysiensis TaxID=92644 RepID=A0A2J7YQ18_STRMQ|nr:hypothetical protein SMF913_25578 [Streptomyces malaysiensis]
MRGADSKLAPIHKKGVLAGSRSNGRRSGQIKRGRDQLTR